eukprot:gene5135-5375_t
MAVSSARNDAGVSGRSRSAGSPHATVGFNAASTSLKISELVGAAPEALQGQLQAVQDAVGACKRKFENARADVTKSLERIQQLEQHVQSLRAEEAELLDKKPVPVNRLSRVRQWCVERAAALETEQAALEGKQMALLKAESQLRARETEADLLAEAAGGLNSTAAQATAAALKRAAAVHDQEVAAAAKHIKHLQAAQLQGQQGVADQQAAQQQQASAAMAANAAARQRLAASQVAIRQHREDINAAASEEELRRRQALLTLKSKIDEVRDDMAQKAERFRQLQKQKREMEKREFEALQEAGLNPYEVYRTRDMEATAARAAAELTARQVERRVKIDEQLAQEDKEYRKKVAKKELNRQVECEYQRQMGIAAQQQRTDHYMRTHTVSGQALLDPTSRLKPYPSASVLVKPAGFGLGQASPEQIRLVGGKHQGLEEEVQGSCLLPGKYRTTQQTGSIQPENACAANLMGDGGENFLQVRADVAAAEDVFDSPPVDDADDESPTSSPRVRNSSQKLAGSGGDHGFSLRSPRHVRKLSKFEQDRLQERKERHKLQVAQPKPDGSLTVPDPDLCGLQLQTSHGRTFAGDAFIADPAEVIFKDWVPGHTYRTTVQFINRSFVKNSIRLLDVPAEVLHVLDLDMPPSGWLAPGASAALKITFTPKVEEDLSASIPLLAETGPLALKVHCLPRNALPHISPSPIVSLNSRAGGVMLAATSSRKVVISNAGSLDIQYDVKQHGIDLAGFQLIAWLEQQQSYWAGFNQLRRKLCAAARVQVTGPLATTTDYEEPQPPVPPANASPGDTLELDAQVCAATSLSVAGFKVLGIRGRVKGHGNITLTVTFTPSTAGDIQVPLLVHFAAPENKALAISPIVLTLTATGRELPVSTLTPLVDFKCVMFGQLYAAPLVVANAGKTAMKAQVLTRPELDTWISFNPDFGYIQADDSLAISVTLKPSPDMLTRLAKYLVPQQQGVLEIPLQVSVPGQTLQVPFKLRLQPTTTDLYISPGLLDFGQVPLSESASLYLTLENPSLVSQAFSFGPKLPPGVGISPSQGYGRILPGERLLLAVKCQPLIPGLQFFGLNCKTTAGRTFRVEGKVEGLEPEVTLSHNVIKFPATAVDDTNTVSLVLTNRSSSTAHIFEFGVPGDSHLQNYWVLDFGALPVGERRTRQVELVNSAMKLYAAAGHVAHVVLLAGPDVLPLSCGAVDPSGVFSIVNALRPVQPLGGTAKVLVAFNPQACCEYYEMLTLSAAKSRIRIAVKGAGIAPSLSVTPASALSRSAGLAFGDVLLSDSSLKDMKLQLTNTCPFTVNWSSRFIGPTPGRAAPISPMVDGAVDGYKGQGLGPVWPQVADRLQILVPYQQQDLVVPLVGSAWPDGVFISGYCDLSQGYVSLPGPLVVGQASSCTLQFGVIKSGVKGAAGELVMDELPVALKEAGWSVEPQKLSTPAGEKRPFVIRFTAPTAAKLQGTPAGALLELGLPVQQTLQLGCTLKGGCQPGPASPGCKHHKLDK